MHPAIFPELRIVSGSLSVKNTRNLGAFDENVMREKVTVSELDLCLGQETANRETCCNPSRPKQRIGLSKSFRSGSGIPP
jgi:hypothetical protein